MSVLHRRIMSQGQPDTPAGIHPGPALMPATPVVMPASEYHYDRTTESLRYGAMEPYWSADVNAGAVPVRPDGTWGRTVPAGRP